MLYSVRACVRVSDEKWKSAKMGSTNARFICIQSEDTLAQKSHQYLKWVDKWQSAKSRKNEVGTNEWGKKIEFRSSPFLKGIASSRQQQLKNHLNSIRKYRRVYHSAWYWCVYAVKSTHQIHIVIHWYSAVFRVLGTIWTVCDCMSGCVKRLYALNKTWSTTATASAKIVYTFYQHTENIIHTERDREWAKHHWHHRQILHNSTHAMACLAIIRSTLSYPLTLGLCVCVVHCINSTWKWKWLQQTTTNNEWIETHEFHWNGLILDEDMRETMNYMRVEIGLVPKLYAKWDCIIDLSL